MLSSVTAATTDCGEISYDDESQNNQGTATSEGYEYTGTHQAFH